MAPFKTPENPLTTPEPTPAHPEEEGVDVAALVHEDIEARVETGKKEYGERLHSNNGRDALIDAYQEALDLALYLRQSIAERES